MIPPYPAALQLAVRLPTIRSIFRSSSASWTGNKSLEGAAVEVKMTASGLDCPPLDQAVQVHGDRLAPDAQHVGEHLMRQAGFQRHPLPFAPTQRLCQRQQLARQALAGVF
jgi:hypothetical protein